MRVFGGLSRRADLENKRQLLTMLRPLEGARILEIGPGDENLAMEAGRILRASSTAGLEYPGCAHFARKPGFDVSECDINGERWPFEDGAVDVVLSNQVIEHVSNTDHFVREVRRVLSPNGYAVISTPNLGAWISIAMLIFTFQPNHSHVSDEFRGLGIPISGQRFVKWELPTKLHLRLFTIRALADLGKVHGLNVEKIHGGSFGTPLLSRFLASVDPWHSIYSNIRFGVDGNHITSSGNISP